MADEVPVDYGAFLGLGLMGVLGGLAIALPISSALTEIEGRAAQMITRRALIDGHADSGSALTIVRQSESKKYSFLNKKFYEVYTASTAREGSALDPADPEDRARAERHTASMKGPPLRTPLPGGKLRVTVNEGKWSGELELVPPPAARPPVALFTFLGFGGLGLILLIASRFARQKPGPVALGMVVAPSLLVMEASVMLGLASRSASELLASVDPNAPTVLVPRAPTFAAIAAAVLVSAIFTFLISGTRGQRAWFALRRHRGAYLAIAPALSGLLVLVGIPFVFGVALSLFHHEHGRFSFVGFDNFMDIARAAQSEGFRPGTLPYSLAITVLWTAANVSLHLGLGLILALLLRRVGTGAARIYRVILIIPWAVPSYLTALIFRSMFDPDTGALNRLLGLEGFSWMHHTSTAFLANLITNVWLGVPFMMVVCLGALTSIPEDIYEAAEVDGASRLAQFWGLTLPLLRPALLPAVILGSIWTFNKFEVIYLVSEGRPDGATDILVTESYRWAFERGLAQGGAYGYAAAYSVVIFAVLLLYSWMTSRVAQRAEEALR